jgi:hypothetical protein
MIVRSAVLEGRVPEDRKAAFDATMATAVVAAIRRYPGLVDVRLRRSVESEEGAPPVYMIFDLYFETLQAMKDALASPVRQEVRGVIAAGMKDFEGRVYHLVLEESR